MSGARVIDGQAAAAAILAEVAGRIASRKRRGATAPGLATLLVGDDPASQSYVRSKNKRASEAGMRSFEHALPANTGEAELLALIASLNRDAAVHGILVQLPLPAQIDSGRVIESVDPAKDVDGFHPLNQGRLLSGGPGFVPCTPLGCLHLIKSVLPAPAGAEAVVVGRSNIVGKPMAQLLLRESCTVTVAHSKTRDLPSVCRRADILVAALGRPRMIQAGWIKPGAIVIDVGINRVSGAQGASRLVGDVDFEGAREIAGAITPVPGGVGPMTIAMLLRNTLEACERAGG